MFVIDFDDTLFNTRPAFRQARVAALKKLGISEDLYDKSYREARNAPTGEILYNSERHARVLGQHGFDAQKILAAFKETESAENLKSFLFPDAYSFLAKLKALGEPMILLSLGEEEFQYQKVKKIGIEKYFDRIFFVNDSKERAVGELLGGVLDKIIWFINDRVNETKAIYSRYPKLRPVLKQSTAGSLAEYLACGLPSFATLTEIYEHIKTHR